MTADDRLEASDGTSRAGVWRTFDPVFGADILDPDRATSPWSGHRWFAYDLVRWMEPRSIVELGTHYGCSFFAFCQAVHDADLATNVTAVDTWQGDPQAGFYGEEVYDLVRKVLDEAYGTVRSELIRATFDEALDSVPDGSVDVLHIDGFHSYEAVSRDYASWLPKLADDGVVLLHDSAPASGYGSARFFAELREREPSFLFHHNFGLGVVLPKGVDRCGFLVSDEFARWAWGYEMRGRYESMRRFNEGNVALIEEKDRAIAATSALVDERDVALHATESLVAERDQTIADLEEKAATTNRTFATLVDEKDRAIEATSALVRERDEANEGLTALVAEKDEAIGATSRLVAERDATIVELTSLLDEARADVKRTARELEVARADVVRLGDENRDLLLVLEAIRREQVAMVDRLAHQRSVRRLPRAYVVCRLWLGRGKRMVLRLTGLVRQRR